MVFNRFIIGLFFLFIFTAIGSRATENQSTLRQALIRAGFENIRVVEKNLVTYVSIEDNEYRWYVDGIYAVMEIIGSNVETRTVSLVMLTNGIPVVEIDLEYQSDTKQKLKPNVKSVSFNCEQSWNLLKDVVPENKPEYKMDLIIDPQLALKNTNFDQIYHIRFNLAPVAQTSLWKGMLISGQLILPVINNIDLEEKVIRPGFITASQNFRLHGNWFGRTTIGNFNAGRYGADIHIKHPFGDSNWSMAVQTGFTGSSRFDNGQWISSKLNSFTWFTSLGYYYPKYDLQMDLTYGRFLNHDRAVRADCTRHFGPTSIGFYAIYGDGPFNGGFHFSIPLALLKRSRKQILRVMPAKYFNQEYNAGTELSYYQNYESRYNENRSEQWIHPNFIKNELIKMIQHENCDK